MLYLGFPWASGTCLNWRVAHERGVDCELQSCVPLPPPFLPQPVIPKVGVSASVSVSVSVSVGVSVGLVVLMR